VAVVLILVQTKQIRLNKHKRNNTKNTVQTIHNTINISIHITKAPPPRTHTNTHITKQVIAKTVQVKKTQYGYTQMK